jgi:hypothetical protein
MVEEGEGLWWKTRKGHAGKKGGDMVNKGEGECWDKRKQNKSGKEAN